MAGVAAGRQAVLRDAIRAAALCVDLGLPVAAGTVVTCETVGALEQLGATVPVEQRQELAEVVRIAIEVFGDQAGDVLAQALLSLNEVRGEFASRLSEQTQRASALGAVVDVLLEAVEECAAPAAPELPHAAPVRIVASQMAPSSREESAVVVETDSLPPAPKTVVAVEPRRVIEVEPRTESHSEPPPKVEHPQLLERTDTVRWVMRCAREVVQRPVASPAPDAKPIAPAPKSRETVVETACRIVRQVLEPIERTPTSQQPARPTSPSRVTVTKQPVLEPRAPTVEPKPVPLAPPTRYTAVPAPAASADEVVPHDEPQPAPRPATEQPQPRTAPPGPDFEPLPAPRVVAEALAVLVSRVRRTVASPGAMALSGEISSEHVALAQLDGLIASLRAPNADPLLRAAELSDALRWLLATSQLKLGKPTGRMEPIESEQRRKRCQRCGSALRRRLSGELICPLCS